LSCRNPFPVIAALEKSKGAGKNSTGFESADRIGFGANEKKQRSFRSAQTSGSLPGTDFNLFVLRSRTDNDALGSHLLDRLTQCDTRHRRRLDFFVSAGITIGRFLSGFATFKLSNKMMIRLGELIILIGLTLLIFPLPSPFVQAGIFIAG
jgi:hypothetical protein